MDTGKSLHFVGKLGPRVYYYVLGQQRSRAYFIPIQPGTPAQLAHWAKWRAGCVAWSELTPSQKSNYDALGELKQMTGFNVYISRYMKDKL